eukprot:9655427-Alexandrium_andersonii.AAC.1
MRTLGASGTNFEAALWLAQFKIRTIEASSHVKHGGLRIEADCGADGPCAACGSHFGRLAM